MLSGRVAWVAAGRTSWALGVRFEEESAGRERVKRYLDQFRARVVVAGVTLDPGWLEELRELCEWEVVSFDSLESVLAAGLVDLVLVEAVAQQLEHALLTTEPLQVPVVCVVEGTPNAALQTLLKRHPRLTVHRGPTTAALLLSEVRRALAARALNLENERLAFELESATAPVRPTREHVTPLRTSGVIGNSEAMAEVYAQLEQVSRIDTPVVLLGETGTGKGLLARVIHELSPRARKPLVTQNCAALTETLLDSELFGHVRGAFTGAVGERPGLFEVASGGTIFLDEIAEMSPGMQAKLLHVLQEGELRRVGSTTPTRVDVRVVCATHADLEQLVEQRRFREDLYYRLVSFVVRLPPLRRRVADIVPLAQYFVRQFAARNRLPLRHFTDEAQRALEKGPWPGNVRQLQHAVERMALMAPPGPDIDHRVVESLLNSTQRPSRGDLEVSLEDTERSMIRAALNQADGVIADAARALGMERSTLSRRMKKLGLRA